MRKAIAPVDTRNHWNTYYATRNGGDGSGPSPFARFVDVYIAPRGRVLDVGCGDGRDANWLAGRGFRVIGIDQSPNAIIKASRGPAHFTCNTINHLPDFMTGWLDAIYARWLLHAIDREDADRLLAWSAQALMPNGIFAAEFRTPRDALFGKGKRVSANEYMDGHYRRFVEPDEVLLTLAKLKLSPEYTAESDNFSPVGNDRPTLARVVARK